MKREYLIESLIVDSVVRILDRHRIAWLNELLENGFKGFANMTDSELQREYLARGLAQNDADQQPDEDPFDDDDPQLQQARLDRNRRDARAFEAS